MHIPDGYLGPQTYGGLFAVMLPLWGIASRRVRDSLQAKHVPLLAMGSAFTFVLMMFNIPAPGGTSGHAVGATLVAIVIGPWVAVIAVSIALIVQAFLFGDGGITAIGANCFNMAFVMPMVGYGIYRALSAGAKASARRRVLAAAVAGYVSLNAAALCAAVELGVQPLLCHRADGTPLYCPYPLSVAVPAMAFEHLLLFGWIEAVATGLVVGYLLKTDPAFLMGTQPSAGGMP